MFSGWSPELIFRPRFPSHGKPHGKIMSSHPIPPTLLLSRLPSHSHLALRQTEAFSRTVPQEHPAGRNSERLRRAANIFIPCRADPCNFLATIWCSIWHDFFSSVTLTHKALLCLVLFSIFRAFCFFGRSTDQQAWVRQRGERGPGAKPLRQLRTPR